MLKITIGLLVACTFGVCTAPADAAVPRRAAVKVVQKSKSLVGKTCDFLWRNKEGIAVGAAVTAVATKPEVVATGTSTILSPIVGGILFYLLIAGLIIAGGRYVLHGIGLWRIVPLVILGLLLSCGVAEAGVIDTFSGPEVQCAILPGKTLWDIAMVAIVILSIFM